MNLQQVTELLPPVVIQIADLIGFPATERLLSAFGGTTFPIGKGLRALGAQRAALLRDTIGDHNAQLLFKNFGGFPLYLPRCEQALRELRNQRFLAEFHAIRQDGISSLMAMTILCPKYGFSDRTGWSLLSLQKNSSSSVQDSLF
ncbi:Mor transcription activator family protein [Klebsiella pneumoniae]|uniref:Mor transcription activator family protein n=1 Tax=Klebsiella pneumoniae TaxID=573 RepID=UPI00211ACF29|nr:Mor transcription activator family protein [Klebsiella pneumoniae]